jgi:hypothetical protein
LKRSRHFLGAALGLSLVTAVLPGAPAAAVHRIHIPHGHGTVRVHGYLRGYQSRRRYVLHARRHQHLSLLVTRGGPTVVSIIFPNGEQEGAPGGVDARLTRTGDYHIRVSEHRMGEPWRGRFTLRVRLH